VRTTYETPTYGWRDTAIPPPDSYLTPILVRLVREAAPTRILDLGSGNGAVTAQLAEIADTVGVDPDPAGVELARSAVSGVRFEVDRAEPGLLERLDEAPFDVVVSSEVVEHVFDPPAWAATAFEAVRPGGVLICSTPYHGYVKNLLLALTGKWPTHLHPLVVGGHIKFFDRRALTQRLTDAGFRDVAFCGSGRVRFVWKSMVLRAVRPA